jgi:hypothetical protein
MQFIAAFNSEDGSGLYLATYDTEGFYKSFHVYLDQNVTVFDVIHYPAVELGNSYSPSYPTVIGVFTGRTWYDAAEVYKQWALKQWWASNKLIDKNATPHSRYGLSLLGCSYVYGNITQVSFAEFASTARWINETMNNVMVLLRLGGWEKNGWVGAWPELFPPVEGFSALNSSLQEIHKYGVKVEPFCGTSILYNTALASYNETASKYASRDENGNVWTLEESGYYYLGSYGSSC